MKIGIKIIVFLTIAFFVARYINQGIEAHDMRFYKGKDNGFFARFESVCILSAIFFALMTDKNPLLDGLKGLATGIIIGILSYFIVMLIVADSFLAEAYYLLSCSLLMITFYVRKKNLPINSNNSKPHV